MSYEQDLRIFNVRFKSKEIKKNTKS